MYLQLISIKFCKIKNRMSRVYIYIYISFDISLERKKKKKINKRREIIMDESWWKEKIKIFLENLGNFMLSLNIG